MKKMLFAFLAINLSFASFCFADGETEYQQNVFTANLGMNMSRIKEVNDTGFGLMAGGKYSYYFSPKVGAFVGLDYMQRNASESGVDYQLTSLDIPFGLAFRYSNAFEMMGSTFLGLYYNSFLDGKSKGGSSATLDGENHLGLLLQTETYFDVNPSLALGFFVGLKFGFGDAITKVDSISSSNKNNTFDFMLGAVARF